MRRGSSKSDMHGCGCAPRSTSSRFGPSHPACLHILRKIELYALEQAVLVAVVTLEREILERQESLEPVVFASHSKIIQESRSYSTSRTEHITPFPPHKSAHDNQDGASRK